MRPGRTPGRRRLLASSVLAGVTAITLPAIAGALLFAAPAAAQDYTSGILAGTVEDEGGAPVAGASVTVTSAQGTSRSATTGEDGSFRMPALGVGAYSVKIEKSGFNPSSQNVSVAPSGQSSYAFTLLTEGATVDEVVVTASRVSDFSRNDTGLSVNVQDLAERVPIGRSITAVTLLTPGASSPDASINASARRNQSLVSLSGTSAAESAYYINGLNVTDQRNFLGFADLPFDALQTVETKTGGYQAEFGRATGGVVNMVTRSGSNEFEGGFSAYWTPDSLRGSRGLAFTPGASGSGGGQAFNQYSHSESKEMTLWGAGPILRDHIFFFGAYNVRDTETTGALGFSSLTATTGTTLTNRYNDPRWMAKFDFVLNEDHKLEATIFSDKTTTDNITVNYARSSMQPTPPTGFTSPILPPSWSQSGGLNSIYKYTGVFTDWFTLSALYGHLENNFTDYGPSISTAGVRDYYDNRVYDSTGPYLTAGRHQGPFNPSGLDERDTYRIDADFYFDMMGDHHLRVGYDREDLISENLSQYSGGAFYYAGRPTQTGATDCAQFGAAVATDGCIRRRIFSGGGAFEAQQTAWYVQDSWQLTPDLSIQLGLRNDIYDYKTKTGQSYVSMDEQFAPRLGFNWDPFGNGTDRVYGSVGDYYLPIATNTSLRATGGEIFEDRYFVATRNAAGDLQLDAAGRPILGTELGVSYLSPPTAPDAKSIAEADLKPMFEREFILGYEHRFSEGFFADWSMGLRYIHRNLESTIEDVAIGDAVGRYCTRTGNATCIVTDGPDTYTPADGADFSGYYPYVLLNPGDEARVYVDLQADAPGSAGFNPQWITLTSADLKLPSAERKYQALEFTFERPFDGTWGLQGSYTLAKSYGNYEGAVKSDVGQTDTSITQDFDHYTNTVNATGYLPNHHRHTFKVFGSYAPTDWLTVGTNFTAQSGRPYGCIGYVPSSVDQYTPSPSGTPSGWFCPIGAGGATVATPRGSQGEMNWTFQTDLNLDFKLYENENLGALTGSINVFNLFDSDTVTRVVEQGVSRVDNVSRADTYLMPRTYQSPRTVRLGLRYKF